jgi:hypothetical protein
MLLDAPVFTLADDVFYSTESPAINLTMPITGSGGVSRYLSGAPTLSGAYSFAGTTVSDIIATTLSWRWFSLQTEHHDLERYGLNRAMFRAEIHSDLPARSLRKPLVW